MLPVLNAVASKRVDQLTMERGPITSIDLMERAARALTDRIVEMVAGSQTGGDPLFEVVCGNGNNGGDGFAVARMLQQAGFRVKVLTLDGTRSAENATNLERFTGSGNTVCPFEEGYAFQGTILIDALLGVGSDRKLEGAFAAVVRAMNVHSAPIIALDLPSGLGSDACAEPNDIIIHAWRTLTIGTPKPSLFLRENAPFVGAWEVVPIGLDEQALREEAHGIFLIEEQDVREALPPVHPWAHKGDHGHAILLAGSKGMYGAAALAANACSRSGVGTLVVHVPAGGQMALSALPQAMTSIDDGPDLITTLPKLDRATAVGMGPGIGQDAATARVLKLLIQETRVPLLLDADALNLLAQNPTWLAFLHKSTVLTPHPKEFDRLAGASASSTDRLARARAFAMKWGLVLVLKGAFTAIIDPTGRTFFNATGNAGMAKGGSGDVLTGLLTGLLARGLAPLDACILGVHLHGMAGDAAATELGMDAMNAADLVAHLSPAWKRLRAGQKS